jgi:hypothetical protein
MENLRNAISRFVSERDWQQFHSPKNLAMALRVCANRRVAYVSRGSQKAVQSL